MVLLSGSSGPRKSRRRVLMASMARPPGSSVFDVAKPPALRVWSPQCLLPDPADHTRCGVVPARLLHMVGKGRPHPPALRWTICTARFLH
jgi:hypothetical protein